MCVAGLTVEVLASAPVARQVAEAPPPPQAFEYAEETVEETDSPAEYQTELDESPIEASEEFQASEEVKDFETVEEYKFSEEELTRMDIQASFEEDNVSAPNNLETKSFPQEFIIDDPSVKEIDEEKTQPAESISEEYLFDKDQSGSAEDISA